MCQTTKKNLKNKAESGLCHDPLGVIALISVSSSHQIPSSNFNKEDSYGNKERSMASTVLSAHHENYKFSDEYS